MILQASLILNILVLAPVCLGILLNQAWTVRGYGEPSDARSILLAVYLAILASSLYLLFVGSNDRVVNFLSLQILYKTLSLLTLRSVRNPVIMSNLLIAIFHGAAISFA